MGPWFIRDESRPFAPGLSYEMIIKAVENGSIGKYTLLRGPTSRQLWTVARHVRGVAHLLGYCHACDAPVDGADLLGVADPACLQCNASFSVSSTPEWIESGESTAASFADADADAELESIEVRATTGQPGSGGGLSAFATDEELGLDRGRGSFGGQGPTSAAPWRGSVQPVSASGAGPAFAQSGAPTGGESGEPGSAQLAAAERLEWLARDGVERSLRRTVLAQQRRVRLLLVVIALLAAVAAWGLRGQFLSAKGQERGPGSSPAPAASDGDDSSSAAPQGEPRDPSSKTTTAPAGSTASAPEGAAASLGSLRSELARIKVDEAALDDRLVALRALIESIEAFEAPNDTISTERAALLAEAQDLLAVLELKSFLPESGAE